MPKMHFKYISALFAQMHILLNLLPRKSSTKLHKMKRLQPKVCSYPALPGRPLLVQYLRSSEKFLCSPMSKCISFGEFRSSSGSCSCLSVCSNYSLLFEFLFCSRFREYARVHPLASYVYLPVFRRMFAHTFRGSYRTREREREREKKQHQQQLFHKLVHNVDVVFLFCFSNFLYARL